MHIKKHLNFTGLRKLLSECFNRIVDTRQKGKVNYSVHDALMSSFACMYFQDPSLLQFQERMQMKQNRNNLVWFSCPRNLSYDGRRNPANNKKR